MFVLVHEINDGNGKKIYCQNSEKEKNAKPQRKKISDNCVINKKKIFFFTKSSSLQVFIVTSRHFFSLRLNCWQFFPTWASQNAICVIRTQYWGDFAIFYCNNLKCKYYFHGFFFTGYHISYLTISYQTF